MLSLNNCSPEDSLTPKYKKRVRFLSSIKKNNMFHKKWFVEFQYLSKKIHFSRKYVPQTWSLKCFNNGKCSYKVLLPLRPNLWPQFRLRFAESKVCLPAGVHATHNHLMLGFTSSSSIYQSGRALCTLKSV